MIAMLYLKGYMAQFNMWDYAVLCENGVVFDIREATYFKHKTKLVMHDDMCMPESGWIEWQCEQDGLHYWTRTRPGGIVACPLCNHIETCPDWAVMLPYEGADIRDVGKDD
jgi:hypothetical protein